MVGFHDLIRSFAPRSGAIAWEAAFDPAAEVPGFTTTLATFNRLMLGGTSFRGAEPGFDFVLRAYEAR